MIGQFIEFGKKLLIAFIIGIPIAIIIMWTYWKIKVKKIRKGIPKNIEGKVKEFKENERRVEKLRQEKVDGSKKTNELVEEFRKRSRIGKEERKFSSEEEVGEVGTGESDTTDSDKNVSRGRELEGQGEIQEAEVDSSRQSKPDSKINWPSFE